MQDDRVWVQVWRGNKTPVVQSRAMAARSQDEIFVVLTVNHGWEA